VLVLISGVGGGEDKGPISDGKAEPLVGLAENLKGALRIQPMVPKPKVIHFLLGILGSIHLGGREERWLLVSCYADIFFSCKGAKRLSKVFLSLNFLAT